MHICFFAPSNNYHTQKWANYFMSKGMKVSVISFIDAHIDGATVYFVDCGVTPTQSDGSKLKYLLTAGKVRKIVKDIQPDIINVHYASSYGAVAAFAGLKNHFLSVWGKDIYSFPKKSFLHKALLKFSLSRAKHIFSTSKAMAEETQKYTKKHIDITPFGVKTDLFTPKRRNRTDDAFIIGTVKALTPKYGIDYLLKAAAIIRNERPDINLKIRIAGKGEYADEYKQLACDLGLSHMTSWLGFISQEEAATEWANMDVGVVASTEDSESFGVSAVEAESCATPVIISDIPGLMEATYPGRTSIVVQRKNERALADAIISLYDNPILCKELGTAGREFVQKNYEFTACFEMIEELFMHYSEA